MTTLNGHSLPVVMDDERYEITRFILGALVRDDAAGIAFMDTHRLCVYCHANNIERSSPVTPKHAWACPIRVARDVLGQEQS